MSSHYDWVLHRAEALHDLLDDLSNSADPEVAQEFQAPAATAQVLIIGIEQAVNDLPEPIRYAYWQRDLVLKLAGMAVAYIAWRANLSRETVEALLA